MTVISLKCLMVDFSTLTIIIQGPFGFLDEDYLQIMSDNCAKVIIVSCSALVSEDLIQDNSIYCRLVVPDPGSFTVSNSKPLNFSRWYAQIKSALNIVDTDHVIIQRSDIKLRPNGLPKIYSHCLASLWCIADTTLSPIITRTPFHYCDWLSGGPTESYKRALPRSHSVSFDTFYFSPFTYQEWGWNFRSIRKAEQLMFAGLLNEYELSQLTIYGGAAGINLLSKTYTFPICIKSSAHLIDTFKGRHYKERPLLIRRMPDDVFPLLWFIKSLIFSFLRIHQVAPVILNVFRFLMHRLMQKNVCQ
jgi:hypothetical protein